MLRSLSEYLIASYHPVVMSRITGCNEPSLRCSFVFKIRRRRRFMKANEAIPEQNPGDWFIEILIPRISLRNDAIEQFILCLHI